MFLVVVVLLAYLRLPKDVSVAAAASTFGSPAGRPSRPSLPPLYPYTAYLVSGERDTKTTATDVAATATACPGMCVYFTVDMNISLID